MEEKDIDLKLHVGESTNVVDGVEKRMSGWRYVEERKDSLERKEKKDEGSVTVEVGVCYKERGLTEFRMMRHGGRAEVLAYLEQAQKVVSSQRDENLGI